ncbi:hypothetical protein OKA05_24475 [Luteolibacter arcticus]|uniref:Ku domain-containing protein n=1 Tax=Luteolibacter arcticus TaxID=1581411 RepID=A0ABT3GQI8_9BACT|nr:Ku protein [Luteolibacter arcticus]MCW1925736.1 hypothetical protein [Luteolibacter arcticus]
MRPQLTKTIEITQFVDLADIEPMLFEKPYYLEPEKRGRKAYVLLRETLRQTGKAGIARVVIRTREYLVAMFVRDDAIILEVMRFPEELRPPSKLDLPASDDAQLQPSAKELDLAKHLVENMTEEWDPAMRHDEYQAALLAYVEHKVASGATAAVKGGERDRDGSVTANNTIELAAYLEKSLLEKKPSKVTAKRTAAEKAGNKSCGEKGRQEVGLIMNDHDYERANEEDRLHFIQCAGKWFDCRDLAEVLSHQEQSRRMKWQPSRPQVFEHTCKGSDRRCYPATNTAPSMMISTAGDNLIAGESSSVLPQAPAPSSLLACLQAAEDQVESRFELAVGVWREELLEDRGRARIGSGGSSEFGQVPALGGAQLLDLPQAIGSHVEPKCLIGHGLSHGSEPCLGQRRKG